MEKEVLRMQGIRYVENKIEFVRDGEFHLFAGEIVGLIGRNHAGKSTLMGAATGEFPASSGKIWILEEEKKIEAIEQARKEGVFLIKSESSLIGELTIKDMLKLNYAFVKKKLGYRNYIKKCVETLDLLGITDEIDVYINELDFYKRVLIEIVQALVCGVIILVFDNVISLLPRAVEGQIKRIFQILKMRGVSLVLVENRPDPIQEHVNRLFVMRRGRVVAELRKEEFDERLIISLSEGEKYSTEERAARRNIISNDEDIVLAFRGVKTDDKILKGLSFSLHKGEILGLWNPNRTSSEAVMQVLSGKSALTGGEIEIKNGIRFNTGDNIINSNKVALVPEGDEVFSNMSIEENIGIAALRRVAVSGLIVNKGEIKYLVNRLFGEYLVDDEYPLFPSQAVPDDVLIRKKIILCRAIAFGAEIIAYNNPHIKLDFREQKKLDRDILKTRDKNISQIVIESHIDSLKETCDRILRMEEGKIYDEI